MKKLFILLFILSEAVAVFAYDFKVDDLCYSIVEDNIVEVVQENEEISQNYISLTEVNIPNSVIFNEVEYIVKGVAADAFNSNLTLESVSVDAEVIGDNAFANCDNLKKATLSNNVKHIGDCAFLYTGLEEITVPESVTYVGCGAFSRARITKLVWNAIDPLVIMRFTHKECDYTLLADYTMSMAVSSITFGDKVKTIPATFCSGCSLESLVFPESLEEIGDYAFETSTNDNIKTVRIPASVKKIGRNAIYWKNLEAIEIDVNNANYASLDGILYDKEYTRILQVPDSLKGDIHLPKTVLNIDDMYSTFNRIPVTSFIVHEEHPDFMSENGILYNKDMSIMYCYPQRKLGDSFNMPNTVKSFGFATAFSENRYLKNIVLSNQLEEIGSRLCAEMPNLESVKIYEGVKVVRSFAFEGSPKLYDVVLPEGVEKIDEMAFSECLALKEINIPSTVESIGCGTFFACYNLRDIYCFPRQVPKNRCDFSFEKSPFEHYESNLHVLSEVVDVYKNDEVYGKFDKIIPMGATDVANPGIEVSPSEDEAMFTWSATENAVGYQLVITKDGEPYCTMDFDKNGYIKRWISNRSVACNGFQFTVTGLEPQAEYGFEFFVLGENNLVIESHEGSFRTILPTSIEENLSSDFVVENGMVICNDEFKIYNISGHDVTSLNGELKGVHMIKINDKVYKVIL